MIVFELKWAEFMLRIKCFFFARRPSDFANSEEVKQTRFHIKPTKIAKLYKSKN